ncbi:hypothetical protein FKM82_030841 [Ascaphus truei]|uniref:cocaine- and amphetamine-regulated transcript protein-like n=1 Tax=Ascaphus truei TaxID=8439 RepID=UPI003F5ADA29
MDKAKKSPRASLRPPRHSALLLTLCLTALILACTAEDYGQVSRAQETLPARNLVDALEEMLEYNQDKSISVQKKASQVPMCDVGERCAMKHGPRIGKLCDCLRGTSCNSFLLRCY